MYVLRLISIKHLDNIGILVQEARSRSKFGLWLPTGQLQRLVHMENLVMNIFLVQPDFMQNGDSRRGFWSGLA